MKYTGPKAQAGVNNEKLRMSFITNIIEAILSCYKGLIYFECNIPCNKSTPLISLIL